MLSLKMVKQMARPVLQFFKVVFIAFVPFYWIKDMSSKLDQLNSNNEEDLKNRRHDNYKRSDVDNQLRGSVRAISILLAMTLGAFGIAVFTVPFLGLGVAAALGIVVGIGILPKIFDMIAKQAIRFISWSKYKNEPDIINTTYPAKYKPFAWSIHSASPDLEQMRIEDNESTYEIMKKLYLKKQEIKNRPQGLFGLSDEQLKYCNAINLAVKFFRNNSCYNSWSYLYYPEPEKNPTKCERVYERTLFTLKEEEGFTSEMRDFLKDVIDLPRLQ